MNARLPISAQTGHGLDVPGTATRGVNLTSTYGVAATNDLITIYHDVGYKALAELNGPSNGTTISPVSAEVGTFATLQNFQEPAVIADLV